MRIKDQIYMHPIQVRQFPLFNLLLINSLFCRMQFILLPCQVVASTQVVLITVYRQRCREPRSCPWLPHHFLPLPACICCAQWLSRLARSPKHANASFMSSPCCSSTVWLIYNHDLPNTVRGSHMHTKWFLPCTHLPFTAQMLVLTIF
jgi:hypothetical protein